MHNVITNEITNNSTNHITNEHIIIVFYESVFLQLAVSRFHFLLYQVFLDNVR